MVDQLHGACLLACLIDTKRVINVVGTRTSGSVGLYLSLAAISEGVYPLGTRSITSILGLYGTPDMRTCIGVPGYEAAAEEGRGSIV